MADYRGRLEVAEGNLVKLKRQLDDPEADLAQLAVAVAIVRAEVELTRAWMATDGGPEVGPP